MSKLTTLRSARADGRRGRERRRRLLTPGERAFLWGYTVVSALLAPVGIALLVFGGDAARGVALACVLVGLVLMAVPISPFLRARLRRREARDRSGEER